MTRTLAFCGLALVCATGARADFIYPGFRSTAGLTLNGNATTYQRALQENQQADNKQPNK